MQQVSIFSLATKTSGLACPRCNSTAFHKYGRQLGIQRYCCRNCRRTFNETVNTPFHGIHNKQKMQDYLLTMHDQQSIRTASKQLGISVPTSFSWRHRILASLKEQTTSSFSSPAGVCEIQLPHSVKGKRGFHNNTMPDSRTILISHARGLPTLQMLKSHKKPLEAAVLIISNLQLNTKIAVDKTSLLTRTTHKIPHTIMQNRSEAISLIELASNTASKLACWMARFNGVATKYLQQYWNWFRAEQNSPNYDQFKSDCFGHRQLQYFRSVVAG